MSIEIHTYLSKTNVPSQLAWQESIDKFGFDFKIDPDLKPFLDSGFSPCKLNGDVSGFEIYYETSESITNNYPKIAKVIGGRDFCISFRFGGDMNELISAFIASAALAKYFDALVYSPADSIFNKAEDLIKEVNEIMQVS